LNYRHISSQGSIYPAVAMSISVLIFILRRPDQFLNPQIWNEEGLILKTLSERGIIETTLSPLAGYLIAPTNFFVAVIGTLNLAQSHLLLYVFAFLVFVTYSRC